MSEDKASSIKLSKLSHRLFDNLKNAPSREIAQRRSSSRVSPQPGNPPEHNTKTREEPERERLNFSSLTAGGRLSRDASPSPSTPPPSRENNKKKDAPPLRDGIHFKNSSEYEDYLMEYLEEYGISEELYDRCRALFVSSSDLGKLHKLFARLGELGYTDSDIQLEKADIFRRMGRLDLAHEALETNLCRNPRDSRALCAMALFYKLQRQYEESVHYLKKWEQVDAFNPEVHYHLGSVFYRVHSTSLAEHHLRECLRLDSRHLRARSLLDKMSSTL